MAQAADQLASVLQVLRGAGHDLDPQQVLDVLWLAGRLPGDGSLPVARARSARETERPSAAGSPGVPEADPRAAQGPPSSETEQADRAAPELFTAPLPAPDLGPAPPVRTDASVSRPRDRPATPLRIPEFKALADELSMGRALRPLKQKRPSRWRQQLDESATASTLAETGLPDVVMRPAHERWLELVIVVDDGLSMLLWHRLAAELRAMMQRLGAFRSVRFFGLDTRGAGPPLLTGRPFDPNSGRMSPTLVTDLSGQTLILVMSDGMGTAWRQGTMHDVLLSWAGAGPVAVIHALPPALWEGSGIQAERWQATTRRPGGAGTAWEITDRVLPAGLAEFTGVPVPVLEPAPAAVRDWARLLTSPGATVELPLLSRPRQHSLIASAQGSGAVQYFRDAATPPAYRLAAHLAAVSPVSVPVMRLVQSAVPWRAATSDLAEVFLGGLLHPVPAPVPGPLPAQHRIFDFHEDVKRTLLDTVPSSELMRTSRHIGRSLEQLAGRAPDFPAWMAHPDGSQTLPGTSRSFTAVERRLMSRFGVSIAPRPVAATPREAGDTQWSALLPTDPERLGPYTLEGRRTGGRTIVYLGRRADGGVAAVRVARPDLPPATEQLLRTEAEALRRLDGRYAPALLDTGLGDTPPWIAMQVVGGQGASPPLLSDLLRSVRPGRTSALDILSSLTLGWHLAGALSLCHLQGIVPGRLDTGSVIVTGRSVLLADLSDCAVDGDYAGAGATPTQADSVLAMGEVLRRISSKRGPALRAASGMQMWQGDSWQPLRDQVLRCLDPDPGRRPSASETAGVLARYVSIAQNSAPGSNAAAATAPQTGAIPPGVRRQPLVPQVIDTPTAAAHDPRPRDRAPRLLTGRGGGESRHQVENVRTPLSYSHRIALIGAHHSCGRVTTTYVLGSVFAAVRRHPVLALDGAPTAGEVYARLARRNPATVRDLTTLAADASYEDVRRFTTALPSGLELLAHSATHSMPSPAYPDEYRRVLAIADRHYPIVLTDWATPLLKPSVRVVLDSTDRLVMCCTTGTSSVETAQSTLRHLRTMGYKSLVANAVVVATRLSGLETTILGDGEIRERFRHQRPVFVPFDSYLTNAGEVELRRLRSRTVKAFLGLASLLVDGLDQDAPPGP